MPRPRRPFRHGHAPGHIREMFCDAIEAYEQWMHDGCPLPVPTVIREIHYVPHPVSIAQACGLLWNCTDQLPGGLFDATAEWLGIEGFRGCTYAVAARAMLTDLKARSLA